MVPRGVCFPKGQVAPAEAVPDVKRLLASLQPPRHAEHWTDWRRRQQARARWYHQRAGLIRDTENAQVS